MAYCCLLLFVTIGLAASALAIQSNKYEVCLSRYNISASSITIKTITAFPGVEPFQIVLSTTPEPGYDDIVTREILNTGMWEHKTSQQVLQSLHRAGKKSLLLDIGANIGWYSLLSLAAGHRVLIIEPSESNACLIKASLCLNQFPESSYELFVVALGKQTQTCAAVSKNDNVRDWSLICPVSTLENYEHHHLRDLVQSVRIDDLLNTSILLNNNPLEKRKISTLKIDIEGNEPAALSKEAATTIFTKYGVCDIFTEVAPQAAKKVLAKGAAMDYIQQLHAWGFVCNQDFDKNKDYEAGMEIFDVHCRRKQCFHH